MPSIGKEQYLDKLVQAANKYDDLKRVNRVQNVASQSIKKRLMSQDGQQSMLSQGMQPRTTNKKKLRAISQDRSALPASSLPHQNSAYMERPNQKTTPNSGLNSDLVSKNDAFSTREFETFK